MKQIRSTVQFLKTRSWSGEANASKKRAENLRKVECREERKDQRPPCLQRRWRRNPIAEGRRASEEKIRRGCEDARSSSDESDGSDASWQVVRKRKRRGRKTMKKTDGREVEEQKKHDDERSTIKMDKDKEYADKDNEHEICVSSRNINKSSARYDFLRDVAQCQVNVAMFQETQQWHHEDRAAAEVGWSPFHLAKEGKTAIAVRKKNMNLLKLAGRSTRWVLIVLASILFPSLHLPHTWSGELNLEEYYKTLSEVDIKQNFHMSAIIAGWQHSNSNSILKG